MYKPESEKGDESEKVELEKAERQEKADQKQQERKQADIRRRLNLLLQPGVQRERPAQAIGARRDPA